MRFWQAHLQLMAERMDSTMKRPVHPRSRARSYALARRAADNSEMSDLNNAASKTFFQASPVTARLEIVFQESSKY
jgi:hypothetical protein